MLSDQKEDGNRGEYQQRSVCEDGAENGANVSENQRPDPDRYLDESDEQNDCECYENEKDGFHVSYSFLNFCNAWLFKVAHLALSSFDYEKAFAIMIRVYLYPMAFLFIRPLHDDMVVVYPDEDE